MEIPSWFGRLYERDRYVWRGRYAGSRFERDCLAEYAEVFRTVCVGAAYYNFPDAHNLGDMVSQVPEDFRFRFKVTDEITIKKFPNLPRFGSRAGKPNENFLNVDSFASVSLGPCEAIRRNVGLLLFEFSRFFPANFAAAAISSRRSTVFLESCRAPGGTAWRFATSVFSDPNTSPRSAGTVSRTCSTVGKPCRRSANNSRCPAA